MDQLILSEDAIIESNGKEIKISKDTIIKIDRNESLFIIDEDAEVFVDNNRILLESGDFIEIKEDGEYKISNDCEIISSGQKFILESGDSINIHEGAGWDAFLAGMNKSKTSRQLEKMSDSLQKIVRKVEGIYKIQQNKNIKDNGFGKILNSTEWDTFRDIANASSLDEAENIIDATKIDIKKIMISLMTAFRNIDQTNIARMIDRAVPRSLLDNFNRIFSAESSSGLTEKPRKIATTKDGSEFLISAIDGKVIAIPMDRDDLVYGDHHKVINLSDGKQGFKIDDKEFPFVKVETRKLDKIEADTVKSVDDIKETETPESKESEVWEQIKSSGDIDIKDTKLNRKAIIWAKENDPVGYSEIAKKQQLLKAWEQIKSSIGEDIKDTKLNRKAVIWAKENDPAGYSKAVKQQKQKQQNQKTMA